MNNFIRIADPCIEKLDNMQDVPDGKFCSICNKNVVDFSEFTSSELQNFFVENKVQQVCGNFTKKTTQDKQAKKNSPTKHLQRNTNFSKIAAGMALTASIINVYPAQTIKPVAEQTFKKPTQQQNEKQQDKKENGNFIISGKMVSVKENQALVGSVSFLTTTNIYTAETDENGYYHLEVPKEILKYESLLEFSPKDFYHSTKLEIINIENLGKKKTVKLENNGWGNYYGIIESPLAGKNSLVIADGKILDSKTFTRSYSLFPNQYIVRYIPKEFVKFFTNKNDYEDVYLVFIKPK
ncbi:hypothetical protein ASG31_17980 [Chryseobacterium sp. Leaf404]|uniref:hypothetical protein n=1 Tax=unclassified Chryseobacterium TaxID=2593645 RepID=UPI0006FDE576|nr:MULTISPECIES: hypothetical protein [unclassified Chryseobacterium]KQT19268.1 hypothetical protein ASG31_17980 [Chryseobacterium sp. Leaf404]